MTTIDLNLLHESEKTLTSRYGTGGMTGNGIRLVFAAHPGTSQLCRCTQVGKGRSLVHPSGCG